MRFRTRLVLTHSLLVFLLTLILGLFFLQYNIKTLEQAAYKDLQVLADNMSHQLDETVKPMQFISEFLISDGNTLSAINVFANADRSDIAQKHVNQAKRDINISLRTYCINENFYAVNIFKSNNDFLSSNSQLTGTDIDTAVLNEAYGKPVLFPPHSGTADTEDSRMVFSLARTVLSGYHPCYIEVQKPYGALEDIYSPGGEDNRVVVISNKGELFYSQLTPQQNACLIESFASGNEAWWESLGALDGSVSAVRYSPYTTMYTVAARGKDAMGNIAASANRTVFSAIVLVSLVSIVLVYISSARLSAPIRQLTAQMQRTTLDNMATDISYARSNDELETLGNTYNILLHRLNQAITREKQLSLLQLQAEFDALQAQVNPHFLYNVLNAISHRGVLSNDEVLCEICDNLAAMLRYSTGTSRRLVTIREELAHVNAYLLLLKARYKDDFSGNIEAEDEINDKVIPKIVLQQIVENSVEHGLREVTGVMRIKIYAWTENGYWMIRVEDNGSGFGEETLASLNEHFARIRSEAAVGRWRNGSEIGGMGLVNVFERMLLQFGENFTFQLSNKAEGQGAVVTIGADYNIGSRLDQQA